MDIAPWKTLTTLNHRGVWVLKTPVHVLKMPRVHKSACHLLTLGTVAC